MKGINKELELTVKRELFKRSYHEFFKFCFSLLFPSQHYEDSPHIKYLCDYIQAEVERMLRKEEKTKDIIINISPRSSKSLIANICIIPWVWIRDPSITFIVVSFDDKLSLVNAQLSRDIIKHDRYQELFSEIYTIRKDADSKSLFYTNKGGFRLSTTTGSNITGLGAMICIVDDPQNPKTAESEVERESVTHYYTNALYNRLTPERLGFRVIIMQRLSELDLTGFLLTNSRDEYHHICIPAEIGDNINPPELRSLYTDGYMDPKRLGPATLLTFKKNLGTRGFAGQYSQRPAPEEGGLIKSDWFDIVSPLSIKRDSINEPIHFFIDSAYTKNTQNDPSSILTCFKQNNYLFILDCTEQWLEFPELIKFIKEYVVRYQYSQNSKIFIEPKASGKSIVQQLRMETMLNVIESISPDTDKFSRVNSVAAIMETRRVKLVDGQYIKNFLEQLKVFPNAAHDDMVDCLTMSIKELLVDTANPDFYFL
jgi:predicted phage terminase large subunit-like protein